MVLYARALALLYVATCFDPVGHHVYEMRGGESNLLLCYAFHACKCLKHMDDEFDNLI
jgi:hypothetical protein